MYYAAEYQRPQYEPKKMVDSVVKQQKPSRNESAAASTQCKICGLVNFNSWALTIHMRRHNNERPAKCSLCPASFVNNSELKSHITSHTKEKNYKCRFCPKLFTNKSTKYNHEDSHGILEHKCKYCQQIFQTQVDRRAHEKTHGRGALTCRYCIKKFANEEFLKLHEQTDHIRFSKCFRCKKKFRTTEELQAHKVAHKASHGRQRSLCGPKMVKRSNEINYFQDSDVKLSSYFFTCGICSEKFSFRVDLTKHIESFHPSHEKENVYKFKCYICGKAFDSKMKLRGHMIGHGPKKYKCPHCVYRTTRGKDLTKHIEGKHSSGKNFKCSECGMTFGYYSTFVLHKLKHGEKNFKCDVCDKAFYVKAQLSTHKRIVHYSANPVCEQCGKIFRNIITLKSHQKNSHNRPTPLCVCNRCGKSVRVKEASSHHTKCQVPCPGTASQKPKGPSCANCNVTFSKQIDLLEHCNDAHPSEVHRCKHCRKEYLSTRLLEKHIDQKHTDRRVGARKHKRLLTLGEKRELRKLGEVVGSNFLYECFACGSSFSSDGEMSDHLARGVCLETNLSKLRKSSSDTKHFYITKVYEGNGFSQVLGDFEVEISPVFMASAPLAEPLRPDLQGKKPPQRSVPSSTCGRPTTTPLPLQESFEELPATVESVQKILSDQGGHLTDITEQPSMNGPNENPPKNGDSAFTHFGKGTNHPSPVEEPITAPFKKETRHKDVVSPHELLLKLLHSQTVNVNGNTFISFSDLYKHLKSITAIDISSGEK